MLTQIKSLGKTLILQWIPVHCGIQGNEKADILAKKGSKIMLKEKQKLLYESIKRIVKKKINDNYNFNLIDTNKDSKRIKFLKIPVIIPEVPRKSAVAMFRLIMGHDCLSKHLHKIGILPSPNCLLCSKEEEMTLDHCEELKF